MMPKETREQNRRRVKRRMSRLFGKWNKRTNAHFRHSQAIHRKDRQATGKAQLTRR